MPGGSCLYVGSGGQPRGSCMRAVSPQVGWQLGGALPHAAARAVRLRRLQPSVRGGSWLCCRRCGPRRLPLPLPPLDLTDAASPTHRLVCSIVSELLAGKFMVDRQTTELMMALDPSELKCPDFKSHRKSPKQKTEHPSRGRLAQVRGCCCCRCCCRRRRCRCCDVAAVAAAELAQRAHGRLPCTPFLLRRRPATVPGTLSAPTARPPCPPACSRAQHAEPARSRAARGVCGNQEPRWFRNPQVRRVALVHAACH